MLWLGFDGVQVHLWFDGGHVTTVADAHQAPRCTCSSLYLLLQLLLLLLHSTLIGLICNLKYSLRFSALNLVLFCAAIWGVGMMQPGGCIRAPTEDDTYRAAAKLP